MSAEVVPLGERLRKRREELGLSQAQAARELDVARTAYRLWEMEAARPAPDRWRLISRWLGVSVATMLLAEELIDEGEASEAGHAADQLGRAGLEWDDVGASGQGDFFAQERATIAEATRRGLPSTDSSRLSVVLQRIQEATTTAPDRAPGELRKVIPSTPEAPSLARMALIVTAAGVAPEIVNDAELLTSELVSNSVVHGEGSSLVLSIVVAHGRLRVEVADEGTGRISPRGPDVNAGWGLTIVAQLADRWGAARADGTNVVWFELDLDRVG